MAITITHAKTNNISDWTQAQLDAQIALGNYPPGTTLNDIVLPSDWNDEHVVNGIGVVTVGVSDGTFAVDDYSGNPKLAIEAALAVSSSIIILPGTYTWTSSLSITDGVEIRGIGNPVFVVNHSGSIGILDAEVSEGLEIDGISFQINTWVASQKIINIAPPSGVTQTVNCKVQNNTFTFGTGTENDFAPTFSAGNEMIAIHLTQGSGCDIYRNTIHPNKGVTGIKDENGFANPIKDNKIKNQSLFYFPIIGDSQRRPCYIGIDIQGNSAPIVKDNVCQNLGLIDADPERFDRRLTHALRIQIPNTGTGTVEYGHEVVQNNVFEDCLTYDTCVVDLRGPRWAMFSGNYFCFNGTADTNGAGFLRITDSDADGTGTNAYGRQPQIVGNHFHNPGTTGAACIYINSVNNLTIQSNVFEELYCTAPIVVDPQTDTDNVNFLTLQGNKAIWPSGTPNNRYFINRIGSDANAAKDLFLDGNVCISGDNTKPVLGWYNGTVFAGTHDLDDKNIEIFVEVVRNKTYVISQKMTYAGKITEATTDCSSGTCTATFDINGTPLGGTANSVSSSEQSQSHTSANSFVPGDTVNMVVTSNSACLDLAATLKIVRGLLS